MDFIIELPNKEYVNLGKVFSFSFRKEKVVTVKRVKEEKNFLGFHYTDECDSFVYVPAYVFYVNDEEFCEIQEEDEGALEEIERIKGEIDTFMSLVKEQKSKSKKVKRLKKQVNASIDSERNHE